MMSCLSYLWDHAVEDRKHDDLSVLPVGSHCLLRTGSMMTCLSYLWDHTVEDRKHDDLSVLFVGSRC